MWVCSCTATCSSGATEGIDATPRHQGAARPRLSKSSQLIRSRCLNLHSFCSTARLGGGAGRARAGPSPRAVAQCSPGSSRMLGSKSIMCGPAGPVVVFFSTFSKLTQALPSDVDGVRPPPGSTSKSQMP